MGKTLVRIGKIIVALVIALIILVVGLYTLELWQSYIMEVIEKSMGMGI